MKVSFVFRATAFMSRSNCHLKANVDGDLMEVQWPELAAYLVNRYSFSVSVHEWGFGYIADMPENAVLALRYMLYRHTSPSREELDEVVAKGTTPLHALRQKLGAYDKDMRMKDLFLKDAVGKSLNLCFSGFPKLILYSNDKGGVRVEFNVENVEPDFLRQALNGELTRDEVEMLTGISLLQKSTQTKYVGLISKGLLSKDSLAKTMSRSASSAKEKGVWLPLTEWLKRNGYGREASEILAKKTLVEGR